ncbi:MAG: hypothetical protein V4666_10705 [Bacteroidota bacterium]
MKIFNSLYLIVLAIFIIFVSSLFWIGSYEDIQKLKQSIFASYFVRFLSFLIIGLIGIIFLILINAIRNTIISDGKISLQRLFGQGLIYVLISSSVGVLLFFVIS